VEYLGKITLLITNCKYLEKWRFWGLLKRSPQTSLQTPEPTCKIKVQSVFKDESL
jgi:hypothetical protein